MFRTICSLIAGIFGGGSNDDDPGGISDDAMDIDGDGVPDKYDINPYSQDDPQVDRSDD